MCPHCFIDAIDEGVNSFLFAIPCEDVMYFRLADVLVGGLLRCQVFKICSSIVVLPVNGAQWISVWFGVAISSIFEFYTGELES